MIYELRFLIYDFESVLKSLIVFLVYYFAIGFKLYAVGFLSLSPIAYGLSPVYTFSFLIYSPMMLKLTVCFNTFRIAAS